MEKEEQLKEWETSIVAVFKRIMGWDVTPRIYYTSSSDFRQKRKEIVEKISCGWVNKKTKSPQIAVAINHNGQRAFPLVFLIA